MEDKSSAGISVQPDHGKALELQIHIQNKVNVQNKVSADGLVKDLQGFPK